MWSLRRGKEASHPRATGAGFRRAFGLERAALRESVHAPRTSPSSKPISRRSTSTRSSTPPTSGCSAAAAWTARSTGRRPGLASAARVPQVRPASAARPARPASPRGHDLPARHVIHTVGPVWHGGVTARTTPSPTCYRNCLALARENGIRTIAFPAISTGVYGFPVEPRRADRGAARSASSSIPPPIEQVQLVCFGARGTRRVLRCAHCLLAQGPLPQTRDAAYRRTEGPFHATAKAVARRRHMECPRRNEHNLSSIIALCDLSMHLALGCNRDRAVPPKFSPCPEPAPLPCVSLMSTILLPWVAWNPERSTPPFLCAEGTEGIRSMRGRTGFAPKDRKE